jgi:hypothetical protein
MQTWRLTVGPDGQVRIPDTKPGEIVVVQVREAEPAPRMTLMDAKTPEERAAIVERLRGLARELRAEYGDDLPSRHGDDGLLDARL